MKTVVVIPGYNESKYLSRVFKRLKGHAQNIVFVDDGSQDSTAEIALRYTPHVLVHEINIGKGAALMTGCQYAFSVLRADAVIFMDADDQHDPAEIPRFRLALQRGSHLVFGVRRHGSDMPLVRFLGNKTASVMLNILFGRYIPDIPSGYKAMTRKGFRMVKWTSAGYSVEVEIAARTAKAGLPFSVVDINAIYHDKDKGMTLLDGVKIAWQLLQWRVTL